MNTGEQEAWERLRSLAPAEVCSRTGARFDRKRRSYGLDLFNQSVDVLPAPGEIIGGTPPAQHLLTDFSYFSRLAVLAYLIHGQDIPPSGRLVRPEEVPGVDVMVRGSHTLPLQKLSARYAGKLGDFLRRGPTWGGVPESYGDASLRLRPFDALPVVLILWQADEEFPARSSLLLDATSRFQAPADILWCVMMLSVLVML